MHYSPAKTSACFPGCKANFDIISHAKYDLQPGTFENNRLLEVVFQIFPGMWRW